MKTADRGASYPFKMCLLKFHETGTVRIDEISYVFNDRNCAKVYSQKILLNKVCQASDSIRTS